MKDKLILIIGLVIALLLASAMVVGSLYKHREYNKMITLLTSMYPLHVTVFKVYPRVSASPYGVPITFNASDPLINEFFLALSDFRSYFGMRDSVASPDHCWFLEVAAGEDLIQIGFYIPAQKADDFVVGEVLKPASSSPYYGSFQSDLLFQWYQKYSHLWLHPPENGKQ